MPLPEPIAARSIREAASWYARRDMSRGLLSMGPITNEQAELAATLSPVQMYVLASTQAGATKALAAKAAGIRPREIDAWIAAGRRGDDAQAMVFADLYEIASHVAQRDLLAEVGEIARGRVLSTKTRRRARLEVPVDNETGEILTSAEVEAKPKAQWHLEFRFVLVEEIETERETAGDWRGVAHQREQLKLEQAERAARLEAGIDPTKIDGMEDADLEVALQQLTQPS